MKYVYTLILTATLILLPASVSAEPDPHTNITPLDEYVAQEVKSFNDYVNQADGALVNLPEALEDLSGILESYLRLSQPSE